ncbi:MAG: hypothetical protein IKA29_04595 [Clostridia bacterium]|nr:hypothetical protein [Clostridia bacterium]
MSKTKLNGFLSKLLFLAVAFCVVYGFVLLANWDKYSQVVENVSYTPMYVALAVVALCAVIKLIIGFSQSNKSNPDRGAQLLVIAIFIGTALLMWFAFSARWPVEYWIDETYSGSLGIGTVATYFFHFVGSYYELALFAIIGEVVLGFALNFALAFVEKKHVKTLQQFIYKFASLCWTVTGATYIMNIVMQPTQFTVKLFFYAFGLSVMMIAPFVKMSKDVCTNCYGYKFGLDFVSSQKVGTYTTYETYNQGSTSFETSDGTKHTIHFVGERQVEHDQYSSTYRCNGCGKIFKS